MGRTRMLGNTKSLLPKVPLTQNKSTMEPIAPVSLQGVLLPLPLGLSLDASHCRRYRRRSPRSPLP